VYHPKFQGDYSDKSKHSQLSHLKFQGDYSDKNEHSQLSHLKFQDDYSDSKCLISSAKVIIRINLSASAQRPRWLYGWKHSGGNKWNLKHVRAKRTSDPDVMLFRSNDQSVSEHSKLTFFTWSSEP